jgi:mono/diheme cytochrome c family protein
MSNQNDFNVSGMVTFAISMAASFAIMIYVSFFSGGVDLHEVKDEAPAAQGAAAATDANAPVDISDVKDPWVPSEKMIAHGRQLFVQNCVMCHGNEGKGDGPAGASLNPKPRNFVEGKWKKGGTRLGLMGVLQTGLPPSSMASYKHLPVKDRWSLVHYIRSITLNKVKDDDADVAKKAPSVD